MGIKDNCIYTRNDQNGESDSLDDAWDDTVLIRAYDNAVKLAKEKISNKKKQEEDDTSYNNHLTSSEQNDSRKVAWKNGSHCRAVYSDDGQEYEAAITQMIPWKGKCVVRYLGYNNEEEVVISTLKPSKGEKVRRLQIEESQKVIRDAEGLLRKEGGKSNENYGFTLNMIPPPPPINMMTHLTSDEGEALSSMLMAWYMSGYHTGYYQGLKRNKMEKKNQEEYGFFEAATSSS